LAFAINIMGEKKKREDMFQGTTTDLVISKDNSESQIPNI
jgi:hypothetical protein